MKRILISTVTLGLVVKARASCSCTESRRTSDHRREQPVLLHARRSQLGRHRELQPTARHLRTRAAALGHAGRHRHVDGRRPVRVEQQGFRQLRRWFEQQLGAADRDLAAVRIRAINTLNAVLDRGPNATGISTIVKNSLLGQAHFLRALSFAFNLLCSSSAIVTLVPPPRIRACSKAAVRDSAAKVYRSIIADLDSGRSRCSRCRRPTSNARRRARRRPCARSVYLTRAYKPFSPSGQADFQAALADAGRHRLRHLLARAGVRRSLVRHFGRSGPHGLLREHRVPAEPQRIQARVSRHASGAHAGRGCGARPARWGRVEENLL